jgi:hypothetical protein
VTLFEADDRIGGHVNTVEVFEGDRRLMIDTGFIVFNRPNYPGLNRLFDQLGVQSQPSKMSFSVKDERHGVEYSGANLGTLFANRTTLGRRDHWRMLGDITRFLRVIRRKDFSESEETVREAVDRLNLSVEFRDRFLSPLGCALWSCPHDAFLDFPMEFVVDFLRNHQLIDLGGRPEWRTVVGGSRAYVDRLVEAMSAEVLVGEPVARVERGSSGVEVLSRTGVRIFDEVVLACHADQALEVVVRASELERELLGSFQFQPNEAILHTDTSVLPLNPSAWASWNTRVPANEAGVATVTYDMNILQRLDARETYCVSLNESGLDESKVIARFHYSHPLATRAAARAKKRRSALVRHEGISYCGAYWGYGFHEDGLRSALDVARAFGEEL